MTSTETIYTKLVFAVCVDQRYTSLGTDPNLMVHEAFYFYLARQPPPPPSGPRPSHSQGF